MITIKSKISFFAAASVFVLLTASPNIFGQETKIKEKDLPPAVAKAFHSEYPNAKILATAKETEKGVTYFEIESKDGKVRRDLLFTKDGKTKEIEERLTAETIPGFVKKSIEAKYKNHEFISGEKNVSDNVTKYEITIKSGKQKYEVICDSKGKIEKSRELNKKSDKQDND